MEIESKVWEFHKADTAKNAEAVINLLWSDFTMMGDGHKTSYEEVAKGSSEFMASLDLFHTEWTDIDIVVLSPDIGISSFLFKDSIIFKSGDVTLTKGPTSFVWQKRKNEWKVIYADADHYPLNK